MVFNSFHGKRSLHRLPLNAMMHSMKTTRILQATILLLLVLSNPLYAFQFSPLEQDFAPSGANSTKTYTIVNDSNDSIAVEITALSRDMDANGKEVNESAAAFFSIVPSKVIVKPQTTQIVRVQYRGPKTVATEMPFRLRAEQIAYSQGRATEGQSMFNFLYVYTTSLYVTPSRVIERVVIDKVTPKLTTDGRQVMAITVSNTGTIHQILNGVTVEVINSSNRQSVVYEGEALGVLNGLNLLAGKTITVEAVWPQNMQFPTNLQGAERAFTAKISYNK